MNELLNSSVVGRQWQVGDSMPIDALKDPNEWLQILCKQIGIACKKICDDGTLNKAMATRMNHLKKNDPHSFVVVPVGRGCDCLGRPVLGVLAKELCPQI